MHKHFDVIAIGGGSGGLAVAEIAAHYGKRVALVEAGRMGGTCVHQGCVPKRVMWYAADAAMQINGATDFGFGAQRAHVDWTQLVTARGRYIENIRRYWERHVQELGITVLRGHARFNAPKQIDVLGASYTADHIVIASGGRAVVPALPGAHLGITSDGFFQLQQQPKRVALIGAGYIAVELASVLHALGTEVSLMIRGARLLDHFDPMISDALKAEFLRQGITLHVEQTVTALEKGDTGIRVMTQSMQSLGSFDQVIWAVGRTPNTAGLDLHVAGVQTGERGEITVDAYQNTGIPGIYAVGDVTAKVPLTPVAIAAGRRLAHRLFGGKPDSTLDYHNIASVVFTHPPAATLGFTEAQARQKYGDDVTIYQTAFTPMRHALAQDGPRTALKLVCAGPNERIVGMHMLGDHADEMLQGFAVAVRMGATKADFDQTVAIHPTVAEEWVTMR